VTLLAFGTVAGGVQLLHGNWRQDRSNSGKPVGKREKFELILKWLKKRTPNKKRKWTKRHT